MPYKKEDLENVNLHELRKLGRELGVKCPRAKKKDDLIKEICLISNGQKLPHTTINGRPCLQSNIEKVETINIKEKLTEEEFDRLLKKLIEKKLDNLFKKIKEEILALL